LAEPPPLAPAERALLVAVARAAATAAAHRRLYDLPPEAGCGRLGEPGATFVTLRVAGELRGCIGSIEPRRALGADVAGNAHAAASLDSRFDPLAPVELDRLEVHVALLSPLVRLAVASRAELVVALAAGRDGLVLEDDGRRATFLPAVWRQLAEPHEFVAQLERKAGLAPGSWSPRRRAYRYRVESLGAEEG
jgi:AmmeMemoRadiSam system protein A